MRETQKMKRKGNNSAVFTVVSTKPRLKDKSQHKSVSCEKKIFFLSCFITITESLIIISQFKLMLSH